jgi:GntR family transcriptional repressor for pyruvate dehydrogenase complex
MPLKFVSATPAIRPRLSEVVLDHLTEKILAGTLRPGDELPSETELANAFQVSKPTVRDALRHLSALGLVEIRQGRPSTIGQVSPTTLSQLFRFTVSGAPHKLQDIIAVRRAIECLAAPAAARNITDAEVDELRALLEQWSRSTSDYEQCMALDVSFHRLIATASRNVLLPFLMDALRGLMEEVIRAPFKHKVNPHPDKTYQRHLALGNAIALRNPELALSLMEEHFDASSMNLAARAQDSGTRATKK